MIRSFITRGRKQSQRDSANRDSRLGCDDLESRIALAVDFEAESKFRSFDWAFKSPVSYDVSLVDTAKNRNASVSPTLMLRGSSSWTSATDGTSTVSGTARGNGTGEFLVEIEPGNFQWLPGSWTYGDSISGDGQGTFTDAKLSAKVSVTGTANVTLPIVGGSSVSYTQSMSLSATGSLVSQTYPHQVPLTAYDSLIVGGEIKLMPSIITTNDTGTFDFGVSGKMQSKKHSFEMKVTGKHPNVADPATPIGRVRLGYSTDKTRSGIVQEINLASEESAIYWNTSTISLSASSPSVRENAPTDAKYVVAYVDTVASGIAERNVGNNVFGLALTQLEYQVGWDKERGGLKVTWQAKADIDENTSVDVYFAEGDRYENRLGSPAYTFTVPGGTKTGARKVVQVPGTSLDNAPAGVTHLIVATGQSDARAIGDVTVGFGPEADATVVSQRTRDVVKNALRAAGQSSATITSTLRRPADQARAMFDNLTNPKYTLQQNIKAQLKLYAPAGGQVVNVFAAMTQGQTRDQVLQNQAVILQAMTTRITELAEAGQRVSSHCVTEEQYARLNVIDVGRSVFTASGRKRFIESLRRQAVSKVLDEPKNSCVHLEIGQ